MARQRTCLIHKSPRQPFEAICVTPCSIMASGTGMMTSSTPIRISPPAMPKMPERNAVPTMVRQMAAVRMRLMAVLPPLRMILLAWKSKLSYLGMGFNFPSGRMRQLPFMNGIKAFEAAARTGSFAKAADELHVTPAAVSRMVHLLEARLGVTLFERKANRLLATPAGATYQAGLTQLFDQLAALTRQVTALGSARVLTVG